MSRIRALSIAFVLGTFVSSRGVAAPPDRAHRAEGGAVVRDETGRRINYDRDQSNSTGSEAPMPEDENRLESTTVAIPSSASPIWGYAGFGEGIGEAALDVTWIDGVPEITVAASTSTFGDDNYWYVLRYDAATEEYEQVHVSPIYDASVRGIVRPEAPGGMNPIVVGLSDGRILAYDGRTKALLGTLNTGVADVRGVAAGDIDDDGVVEFVLTTLSSLRVFSTQSGLEWELPVGGHDVVFGQMDDDPSLELAVTDGSVVDVEERTVQWSWPASSTRNLRTADIDDDGMEELITAEAWYIVWAFDVDLGLPKWSIPVDLDVGAIQVLDIDGDSVQELLVGDGQHGEIHAYDTISLEHEWSIDNPEHGVTNIAASDVDGDGDAELLWGSGATSTGPDRLYVADWRSATIEWENVQLDGPFLGPLWGDLDGDSVPELIFASWSSDAGWGRGRIVVLDNKLDRRVISDQSLGGYTSAQHRALELYDVDGDGRLEILLATESGSDGVIEVYDFEPDNRFVLNWTNATRPRSMPFHSVAAADVDGDGALEIVGGVGRESTGGDGVFVYIYDYASAAEEWHSLQMGSYFGSIPDLSIGDFDLDSELEIAALIEDGDVYFFDGPTKELEDVFFGDATALASLVSGGEDRILTGEKDGDLVLVGHDTTRYVELFRANLLSNSIVGINFGVQGHVWLASGDGTLSLTSASGPVWTSETYGSGFGRVVTRPGSPHFFLSAGTISVVAFELLAP